MQFKESGDEQVSFQILQKRNERKREEENERRFLSSEELSEIKSR